LTNPDYYKQYPEQPPDHDRFSKIKNLGGPSAGQPQALSSITDGTSNTLLLSEVIQGQKSDLRGFTWWGGAAGFPTWSLPNANDPDMMLGGNCDPDATRAPCLRESQPLRPRMMVSRSWHPGGVQSGFCDGHVAFIKNSIAIDAWRALSTSRGGENI